MHLSLPTTMTSPKPRYHWTLPILSTTLAPFWAVVFTLVVGVSTAGAAEKALPKIDIEGVKGPDKKVLETAVRGVLTGVQGHLPLPKEINMTTLDPRAPYYRDDVIAIKFPWYREVHDDEGKVIKTLRKSAQDSLGINLHELAHQLFETWIYDRFLKTDPTVVWAFFTRGDMMGEPASRELIEKTKGIVGLQKESTDVIFDHYFSVSSDSGVFNEFIADVLPVLFLNDPDAVYRSAYFDAYDDELLKYRRFAMKLTPADIRSVAHSEYDSTILAKQFVWKEIAPLKMSFGQKMAKVFAASLGAFREISLDFTKTDDFTKDPEALGKILIGHLKAEFADCEKAASK